VEIKKGEYDFAPYDELFSSLAENGIRPLMILDYGNPLYDNNLAPHTDEGRAAFGRFVEAGAARYKGRGIVWEIWNEPNHPTFWKPYPHPENYVKLAKVAYAAVKKHDPNAPVIGPALSSWDFPFLESLLKLGLLDHVDAVSVHPYGSAKPEDAFNYYDRVRALIRKYAPEGKIMPVVSGEWGYPSFKGTTLERQAQFIVRQFLTNLMNDIPLSIWFDWRNNGLEPDNFEHNCGVVDFRMAEKPAFKTFQTFARYLDGFAFAACVDAGSDDDYLALFTKGSEIRMAAWTTGKSHTVKTPVDVDKFEITSPQGEVSEASAKEGRLQLELTESPVFIRPVESSRRWTLEAEWRVSAETEMEKGAMSLRILSNIGAKLPDYEFAIGHSRLQTKREKLEDDRAGGSVAVFTPPYVSNGEPKARLKVKARVLGLSEPLTRLIGFQNSVCPTIRVLPPTDDALIIEVSQPESGKAPAFGGRLFVGNYQGIRLTDDSVPIRLRAGSDRQIVRLKMTHRPAGVYSFSCRLADNSGEDIAKLPTKRYSLIETFSGGKPGAAVVDFGAILGGDVKALGEVSLTYASAPKGAPAAVCAKLNYRFDPGWKYAQIVPKSPLKIVERPRYVRIWIRGEGNGVPAHLRYVGSDQQHFQQIYGRLDTPAWEVMEGDVSGAGITYWGGKADGIVRYPLSWDSLLLIDNPSKLATTGTVHVGPMMICYD
jgi:hypothetical protein